MYIYAPPLKNFFILRRTETPHTGRMHKMHWENQPCGTYVMQDEAGCGAYHPIHKHCKYNWAFHFGCSRTPPGIWIQAHTTKPNSGSHDSCDNGYQKSKYQEERTKQKHMYQNRLPIAMDSPENSKRVTPWRRISTTASCAHLQKQNTRSAESTKSGQCESRNMDLDSSPVRRSIIKRNTRSAVSTKSGQCESRMSVIGYSRTWIWTVSRIGEVKNYH